MFVAATDQVRIRARLSIRCCKALRFPPAGHGSAAICCAAFRRLSSPGNCPRLALIRLTCDGNDSVEIIGDREGTIELMSVVVILQVAGSLACAKRGWVNVGVARIECEICRAQLDFAVPSASSFEGESIIVMDFFFLVLLFNGGGWDC